MKLEGSNPSFGSKIMKVDQLKIFDVFKLESSEIVYIKLGQNTVGFSNGFNTLSSMSINKKGLEMMCTKIGRVENFTINFDADWSSPVARKSHKLEVVSSNLTSAT